MTVCVCVCVCVCVRVFAPLVCYVCNWTVYLRHWNVSDFESEYRQSDLFQVIIIGHEQGSDDH